MSDHSGKGIGSIGFLAMTKGMRISVVVRRGKMQIEERDGTVVVYTTEKRENNRANLDVIKQLSRHYSIPPSAIRIIAGATSTRKIVEIRKANEGK